MRSASSSRRCGSGAGPMVSSRGECAAYALAVLEAAGGLAVALGERVLAAVLSTGLLDHHAHGDAFRQRLRDSLDSQRECSTHAPKLYEGTAAAAAAASPVRRVPLLGPACQLPCTSRRMPGCLSCVSPRSWALGRLWYCVQLQQGYNRVLYRECRGKKPRGLEGVLERQPDDAKRRMNSTFATGPTLAPAPAPAPES